MLLDTENQNNYYFGVFHIGPKYFLHNPIISHKTHHKPQNKKMTLQLKSQRLQFLSIWLHSTVAMLFLQWKQVYRYNENFFDNLVTFFVLKVEFQNVQNKLIFLNNGSVTFYFWKLREIFFLKISKSFHIFQFHLNLDSFTIQTRIDV